MGPDPAQPHSQGDPPLEETRLFRVPAGYQATLRLERDGTWTLVLDHFYEGEMWSHLDRDVYAEMSLLEATETVISAVFTART